MIGMTQELFCLFPSRQLGVNCVGSKNIQINYDYKWRLSKNKPLPKGNDSDSSLITPFKDPARSK